MSKFAQHVDFNTALQDRAQHGQFGHHHTTGFAMQITGPFNIKIIDNTDTMSRELHLSFTPRFQQSPLPARIETVKDHMAQLEQNISQVEDEASRQGMLMLLQITEQLLPHIEQDEIPLEETIVIEIGSSSPLDKLLQGAVWR